MWQMGLLRRWSEGAQELVERAVALHDAGLHAAGDEGVPALHRLHDADRPQEGAAARERGQREHLEGDAVGEALVGEGRDDPLGGPQLRERAVEAELLLATGGDVAPAAPGAG